MIPRTGCSSRRPPKESPAGDLRQVEGGRALRDCLANQGEYAIRARLTVLEHMTDHRTDKPLFDFLDLDVSEIHERPTAIAEIRAGTLHGSIIRNVYSPEEAAIIAARLERGDPGFSADPFRKSVHLADPPRIYGRTLNNCAPDLRQYCAEAADFRRRCRELFCGMQDFEERITEVFRALTGGLPVEVPVGPEPGQIYAPATIRLLPQGHGITPHADNSLYDKPQAWHLSTLTEPALLSFFLTLSLPQSGGELVVYALRWEDFRPGMEAANRLHVKHGETTLIGDAASYVRTFASMSFKPGVGDLFIFNAGRYFHEVTPGTDGARCTIGGFIAPSRDHERLYYWS